MLNGHTFVVEKSKACAPMKGYFASKSVNAGPMSDELKLSLAKMCQAPAAQHIQQFPHGAQLVTPQAMPSHQSSLASTNAVIPTHQFFPGVQLATQPHKPAPAPTNPVPHSLSPVLSLSVDQIAHKVHANQNTRIISPQHLNATKAVTFDFVASKQSNKDKSDEQLLKEVELLQKDRADMRKVSRQLIRQLIACFAADQRMVHSKHGNKQVVVGVDHVAQSWFEDCSKANSRKLWMALFGCFDGIGGGWVKFVENLVMRNLGLRHNCADVSNGCVYLIVSSSKREVLASIQKRGESRHGWKVGMTIEPNVRKQLCLKKSWRRKDGEHHDFWRQKKNKALPGPKQAVSAHQHKMKKKRNLLETVTTVTRLPLKTPPPATALGDCQKG